MKSFTRIGLPILVVVVAVFGITFVRVYSPDDPATNSGPKTKASKATSKDALRIPLPTAAGVSSPPERGRESLTYWDPEIEFGVPGHFEFWGYNPHPDPVVVRVYDSYCQCAGVDVAAVPQDQFKEYAVESALAGGPLCPAPGPLAAAAHAVLSRRLPWAPLQISDGGRQQQTIPGADPAAGNQVVVFRLSWKARGEPGPKVAWATLLAGIGDAQPSQYRLEATSVAVPAFELARRDGANGWSPLHDLSVGDLRENGAYRHVVYLMSTTRPHAVYRVSADRPDPCVTWTEPVPASPDELLAATDFFSQPDFVRQAGHARRIKSLYKFEVAVRERAETDADGKKEFHQLELGLLDRRLTIKAVDGGSYVLPVKARVFGEVNFLSGAPDGRIDMGNSFAADQDETKVVILLAERPDVDLAVVAAETTPNYLKVKLEPIEKIDGRNQWRLRVTVPKRSVYGALPPNSAVVLTTTGPNPRKLRIPVRGTTYDSGASRF